MNTGELKALRCVVCRREFSALQFANLNKRLTCSIDCAKERWRKVRKNKRAGYAAAFRERHPERLMLQHAKKRAKDKGLPFELTPKDIVIPEFCPVLGLRLKPSAERYPTDASPSLDKLIPSKGYVRGNVFVISHRANSIKRDASLEELEKLVLWLRPLIQAKSL